MKRLATLRDFCAKSELDLKLGLEKVAAYLSQRPLSGTFGIVVTGGERRSCLLANLNKPGVDEVTEGEAVAETTDFLIYVENEALLEILRGELSPLSALFRGRLRYAGDEKLGVAIFRELASTQDAVFEPCRQQREH